MKKCIAGLVMAVLLFAGCEKKEEPVRQLFFPEYSIPGQTVETPAWFYPETGEVEYLCPDCPHTCMHNGSVCDEEVHGEECLFYKFDDRRGYSLREDTLYYFLSDDLYMFDTITGERERLKDTAVTGWGNESYIFKGEYLYRYDPDSENGQGYSRIERIHLPDMAVTDISGQTIPARIVEDTAYYVIADSSPYIVSGMYRQPLYAYGEEPPAKELPMHEAEFGIAFVITEDAVYWIGSDALREDLDTIIHNLYRYDFAKQSIILAAEDFYSGRIVSDGEYLYAVCQQEDGYALLRTDDYGIITVLGSTETGERLLMASVDMEGQYVIADMVSDKADGIQRTGKMVYDTETGAVRKYWLQEKTVQ